MHTVFVYGSLKQGKHNSYLLDGSKYLGAAKTLAKTFKMFDLGAYPAIKLDAGNTDIKGELFEVDDRTLASLDWLEGYPELYNRTEVDVSTYTGDIYRAIVYHMENPTDGFKTIDDGDWL